MLFDLKFYSLFNYPAISVGISICFVEFQKNIAVPDKCNNVLWIKLWGKKNDVKIEIKQIVKKPIIPWYPKLSVRKSLKKKLENK